MTHNRRAGPWANLLLYWGPTNLPTERQSVHSFPISNRQIGTLSLGWPPLPIQCKLIWIQFLFGRSLGLDRLAHYQKRQYRVVTWQWHRVFPNAQGLPPFRAS